MVVLLQCSSPHKSTRNHYYARLSFSPQAHSLLIIHRRRTLSSSHLIISIILIILVSRLPSLPVSTQFSKVPKPQRPPYIWAAHTLPLASTPDTFINPTKDLTIASMKMEAPLSSPRLSSQNQTSYFSSTASSSAPSTQSSGPTSAPQSQQQIPQPPPPQQRSNDTTSPFLRDFNLVAEAAKRAQMACLMRDLEGVAI